MAALHKQLAAIIEKTKQVHLDQENKDKKLQAKCKAPMSLKPEEGKNKALEFVRLVKGTNDAKNAVKALGEAIGENPMRA